MVTTTINFDLFTLSSLCDVLTSVFNVFPNTASVVSLGSVVLSKMRLFLGCFPSSKVHLRDGSA